MKQETEPEGECADAEHSAAQRASEKKIHKILQAVTPGTAVVSGRRKISPF